MAMRLYIFCCVITLGLLANLSAASFTTTTFRDYCESKKCPYGNVGVGVGGYAFNALHSNFGSSVGYVYGGGGFVHNQRVKFDADVRVGVSRNTLQGNNFPSNFATSLNATSLDFRVKLGQNVLSKETPLFISVVLGLTLNTPNKISFGFTQALLGVEVDGQVHIAPNLILSYGGGYGWLAMGYTYTKTTVFSPYKNNEIAESRSIRNFEFNANVGLSYQFHYKYAYFIRALGRFQHIGASETIHYANNPLTHPQSNNFIGMLETGIEF